MDVKRDSVIVGYPYGTIDPRFHRTLLALFAWDAAHKQHVIAEGHIQIATTNLPQGRNDICTRFLDDYDAEWLWFCDTDQVVAPDTLDRMLASADRKERPILGALVYSYDEEHPTQRSWPTVWEWDTDGVPRRPNTLPRHSILACHATGTGCVLIHRTVLEAVRAEHGHTAWPFFRYGEWTNQDGKPDIFGEDLTFMARAGALGFPIHVDTGIVVGHVKSFIVDDVWHYRELPLDRMLSETYVVIPVRDRLDLTRDLLYQLKAQGDYSGIFVFDNGSGAETREWLKGQTIADVWDAEGANIHEMWNAGCAEALRRWRKPNVAILNNDLKIGPGFLRALATGLRSEPDLIAVGPNYDGRELTEQVTQVRGICAARYDGTGGLPGFAFMVRGEAAEQRPLFDEQYEYWYGDNDFLLTVEAAGLTYGLVRDATVEHIGGATDDLFAVETEPKKQRDRQRFEKKWSVRV
jgi:GT2 family glycosyltransferase